MAITFKKTPDYVLFIATGIIEPGDLVSALETCWREHESPLALWDATAASVSGLGADSFQDIILAGRQFTERRGLAPRTAIAARNEADATLLKAFVGQASLQSPIFFGIFLNLGEAKGWLLSPPEQQDR